MEYLMNPHSGTVQTDVEWLAEMHEWGDDEKTREEQFKSLIPVVKDENGDWVEA
jgi:hypothetical protein